MLEHTLVYSLFLLYLTRYAGLVQQPKLEGRQQVEKVQEPNQATSSGGTNWTLHITFQSFLIFDLLPPSGFAV